MTGIDAIDVRCVIFPGSAHGLVTSWQGAGRAGRYELDAKITVQFHENDLSNVDMEKEIVARGYEGSLIP